MTRKIHQASEGLIQNAVAISAHLHTHAEYDIFYSQMGSKVNGFTGIYDIAVGMAKALTDYEGSREDFWEDQYWSWEEVVEAFVDAAIRISLRSGFVPDAGACLRSALRSLSKRRSRTTSGKGAAR